MMRKGYHRVWGAMALVWMAACSGDGTGAGDILTPDQSSALLSTMDDMLSASKQVDLGSDGKFTIVVPCSFKGEVDSSGKVTFSADSSSIAADLTLVFVKCRQGSDAGVFVLDGTLREVSTEVYDDSAQTSAFDSRLTGNLAWTVDKQSGSCDIDLTLAVRATAITSSTLVTGSFCGTTYPKT